MSRKKKRKVRKQKDNRRIGYLEELSALKKEILESEAKIAEQKRTNIKEFHIRNLKVFLGACNFLIPFVIVGGIATGGGKVLNGGFPFYRDDITRYKMYEFEYETDKDINLTTKYGRDDWLSDYPTASSLTVKTPWKRDGNDYYRYNREYVLSGDYFLNLSQAILREDYEYISENYKDFSEEKEVSNSAPENEDSYFIEAKLSGVDREDFIKFPESFRKNCVITILEVVGTLGLGAYISHVRDYDFLDDISDVNDDYQSNIKDIKPLLSELEETKKKVLKLTNKVGDGNVEN